MVLRECRRLKVSHLRTPQKPLGLRAPSGNARLKDSKLLATATPAGLAGQDFLPLQASHQEQHGWHRQWLLHRSNQGGLSFSHLRIRLIQVHSSSSRHRKSRGHRSIMGSGEFSIRLLPSFLQLGRFGLKFLQGFSSPPQASCCVCALRPLLPRFCWWLSEVLVGIILFVSALSDATETLMRRGKSATTTGTNLRQKDAAQQRGKARYFFSAPGGRLSSRTLPRETHRSESSKNFGACAPGWRTSSIKASHNASWSMVEVWKSKPITGCPVFSIFSATVTTS